MVKLNFIIDNFQFIKHILLNFNWKYNFFDTLNKNSKFLMELNIFKLYLIYRVLKLHDKILPSKYNIFLINPMQNLNIHLQEVWDHISWNLKITYIFPYKLYKSYLLNCKNNNNLFSNLLFYQNIHDRKQHNHVRLTTMINMQNSVIFHYL